jgi:NAD+ kinase
VDENMRHDVTAVAILGKASRPDTQELGRTMRDWLHARGIDAAFYPFTGTAAPFPDLSEADVVVVLGGDGTLVGTARRLPEPRPLLGVNFGRVGFLADLEPHNWEAGFESMLRNGIRHEWTLGLSCVLERGGQELQAHTAINDIVITRGALARLGTLDISVDGVFFTSLRADGLILSTPTGSTGYTGSARGPLLHPVLNAYALTPICPYISNFLPLVLEGNMSVSVTVRETNAELFMTVDGQELAPLEPGDRVRVRGRAKSLCFARLGLEAEYFAKIRAVGLV